MLRRFININVWLSHLFDRLLPKKFLIDGNNDFGQSLLL